MLTADCRETEFHFIDVTLRRGQRESGGDGWQWINSRLAHTQIQPPLLLKKKKKKLMGSYAQRDVCVACIVMFVKHKGIQFWVIG